HRAPGLFEVACLSCHGFLHQWIQKSLDEEKQCPCQVGTGMAPTGNGSKRFALLIQERRLRLLSVHGRPTWGAPAAGGAAPVGAGLSRPAWPRSASRARHTPAAGSGGTP